MPGEKPAVKFGAGNIEAVISEHEIAINGDKLETHRSSPSTAAVDLKFLSFEAGVANLFRGRRCRCNPIFSAPPSARRTGQGLDTRTQGAPNLPRQSKMTLH